MRKPVAIGAAAFMLFAPMLVPSAAMAAPAPDAETTTLTNAGAFNQIVPNGVCSVRVTVAGAPGGSAVSEGDVEVDPDLPGEMRGVNGAGSVLTTNLTVGAGESLTGFVGQPGIGGTGGQPGGGEGSVSSHRGAGGGGYSSISLGVDLLLLAGGGGGTGGGHTSDFGWGGDAGADTTTGVALTGSGTVFAGSDGVVGQDLGWNADPITVPGAGLGGSTVGGAGGENPFSNTDPDLPGFNWNGTAGSALQGGAGGADDFADGGGGGGAGFFGGGGGASTNGDVGTAPNNFIGGGGGGGSTFVAEGFTDFDLAKNRGAVDTDNEGLALSAYVSFEWVMCNYDLAVAKTALGTGVFEDGDLVSYEVTVTNLGTENMAIGDTVSVIDDLAVGGTLLSVSGALTASTPAAGEVLTDAGIELFNEVDIDGTTHQRGLAVGESVTVVYEVAVKGTEPVENTVSVSDRGSEDNNLASATVVPAAPAMTLVKSSDTEKITTVGQKVAYSFVVTNTGNIALHDVAIAEGKFSGKGTLPTPVCPAEPVAPAASVTCTSTYIAVAGDLTGADLTNTATAEATTPGGAAVGSNESTAKVVTVKPVPLVSTGGADLGLVGIGGLVLLGMGAVAFGIARSRNVNRTA